MDDLKKQKIKDWIFLFLATVIVIGAIRFGIDYFIN